MKAVHGDPDCRFIREAYKGLAVWTRAARIRRSRLPSVAEQVRGHEPLGCQALEGSPRG
jgi:hypothetical protein